MHDYYYASGRLLREVITTTAEDETVTTSTLDFFYDASGMPYALKYNGTLYYYITNLQGDVVYLVDGTGATVVTYEYDPFGKVISATGTMAEINPLRYRGYYYDTETGFYYLQSRYYDPAICRFINADALVSTGQGLLGYNMFAYCLNNPIVSVDLTGTTANLDVHPTRYIERQAIVIACAVGAMGAYVTITAGTGLLEAATDALQESLEELIEAAKKSEILKFQYWEAWRDKDGVHTGRGLTFGEATLRVAVGLDIMCANQDAARWLIVVNRYWGAVGPEIHGEDGYFWHYHPHRHSHSHIWYL